MENNDELKILKCFRKALTEYLNISERGAQTKLAKKIGRRSSYISDIVNERRTGSEEKRREIAKIIGYDYDGFIKIGESLLKGESWQQATNEYKKQNSIKAIIKNDKLFQDIYKKWKYLSNEQKEYIANYINSQSGSFVAYADKIEELDYGSEARSKFIWYIAFNELKLPVFYDKFFDKQNEKYFKHELSDIELYEHAKKKAQEYYDQMEELKKQS